MEKLLNLIKRPLRRRRVRTERGAGKVIVAGMPKSGTTAIASLLGAAMGRSVVSDPFYQMDKNGIQFREPLFSGKLNIADVWMRHPEYFDGDVIKDPNFPLLFHDLSAFLPRAKKVCIFRDPRDNLRSLLNRVALPGNPQGVDLKETRVNKTWSMVLGGEIPKIPGSDYLEVLAWRWLYSFREMSAGAKGVEIIRYEDFNKDKLRTIYSLVRKMGFEVSADIGNAVDKNFQPPGKKDTDLHEFFGVEGLKKIEEICEEGIVGLGYEKNR